MLSWRFFTFVSLIYIYRIARYLRSETMFSSSFVSVTLAQSQNYPNSKQNKCIILFNLQSIFVNVISFISIITLKLLLSPFCKWDIPSCPRSSWYSVVNLDLELLLTAQVQVSFHYSSAGTSGTSYSAYILQSSLYLTPPHPPNLSRNHERGLRTNHFYYIIFLPFLNMPSYIWVFFFLSFFFS